MSPIVGVFLKWFFIFSRYTHALQALSHSLLLAPQNPFVFLQFAETAYTSGDIPLALKMFLVVLDMNETDDIHSAPEGISTRAWWGVKLVRGPSVPYLLIKRLRVLQCTRQLLSPFSPLSPSVTPIPENVNLIDELATEQLLKAYGGATGARARKHVSNWMSNSKLQ
jgi:hypothetical protein